jgi:hypothetical protein
MTLHRNHMGLEHCIEVLTQDIRPRAKFNARLPGFVDLIKEDLLLLSYYLASRYLSRFSFVTNSKGTKFFLSTFSRLISFNNKSIATLP